MVNGRMTSNMALVLKINQMDLLTMASMSKPEKKVSVNTSSSMEPVI